MALMCIDLKGIKDLPDIIAKNFGDTLKKVMHYSNILQYFKKEVIYEYRTK